MTLAVLRPVLAAVAMLGLATVTAPAQTLDAMETAIASGDAAGVVQLAQTENRSPAEAAYLEGRAHLVARNFSAAVAKLREALRLAPTSRRARWYLIQALVGAEDFDAAVFHIDALRPTARNAGESVRLANLRRSVLARRPAGYTLGFSIQPSSNINRATQNETLPSLGGLTGRVDNTGEAGLSATLSAGAYRRFELGEVGTLTATVGGSATRFSDDSFDRYLLNGGLTLRRPAPDGSLSFTLEGYRGIYADEDQDFVLLRAGIGRQYLHDGARYSVRGRIARQLHDDPAIADRKDNTRADLGLSMTYPLSDRLVGTAGLELISTNTEDPRFSFLGGKGSLGLRRSWANGWTVGVNGSIEHRRYQQPFGGIFPFKREDTILSLGASVGNTRVVIQGFTPVVSCRMERSRSNVTFYDNVAVEECALSITRNF